ncbi:MAG: YDG domain-containing protein [Oscillospiraceae bacterium]|nr:YDG domain-containing protein [Oscillospiraceae bacterium]
MKRFISLVLSVLMVLSSIAISAIAAPTDLTFTVGDESAQQGNNVQIPITCANNDNRLSAVTFTVTFDSTRLEWQDLGPYDFWEPDTQPWALGGFLPFNGDAPPGSIGANSATFVFMNMMGTNTVSGTLITLKLHVKDNAPIGDADITLSFASVGDSRGPLDNTQYNNIPGKVIVVAPPDITTSSPLPATTVGNPYSTSLEATGGNITWNSTDLPDWLSLNKDTGELSGTPTAPGEVSFNVTATNDIGSDTKPFTLTVNDLPEQVVSFDTANPAPITFGQTGYANLAIVTTPVAGGGTITYASSDTDVISVNSVNGVLTTVGVGTATITATAAAIPGYKAGTATYSITVNPKPVVITPDSNLTKVYGEDDPELGYTHDAAPFAPVFTGALARDEGENVGIYAINIGTLDAGTNYSLALNDANIFYFDITKATYNPISCETPVLYNDTAQQVVDVAALVSAYKSDTDILSFSIGSIADDDSILYGTPKAFINSSTGELNFTLIGELSIVDVDKTAVIPVVVGNFNNYVDTIVNVTVRVIDKEITTVSVTAPANVIYGQTIGDPSAEAAAGGNTFTYSYSGTLFDSGSSSYGPTGAKPTQPGTYTVTATLDSATHYGTSNPSAQFTIAKKTLTWAAAGTANGKIYDGNVDAAQNSAPILGGIEPGDVVTVTEGALAFSSKDAGTRAVNATGYGIVGADSWKYNAPVAQPSFGNAVIERKELTIQGASHTKVYDNTTAATGVTVMLAGFVAGDTGITPNVVTAVYTGANAGTTTINISSVTLQGVGADNYIVTPRNGVAVAGITKRPLNIQSASHTKVYDNNTSADDVIVTLAGFVAGDTGIAPDVVTAAYTSANAGTTTINITSVTLQGAGTDNYTVTPRNGIPVEGITKKPLTADMISSIADQTYTGAAITPTPAITDAAALIQASDYTWSYNNNIKAGQATAIITATAGGNYSGFASTTFNITLDGIPKENTPAASVDFIAESLTSLVPDAAYEIEGSPAAASQNGSISIDADWIGKTIQIVKTGVLGQGVTIDSDAQSLAIPPRPDAPTGIGKQDTTGGLNNGTLTGLETSMEYRSGTGAWITAVGETATNLAAGTYQVRYKATTSTFASGFASLVIAPSTGSSGNNNSIGVQPTPTPTPTPDEDIQDAETPLPSWPNPYTDVVDTNWFYDAVQFVTDRQLMNGTDEDKFSPGGAITRAMLVTILYRLEGSPDVSGDISFSDVDSGQWYSNAILWASQNGIVKGYSSEIFGLNDPVTREQAVSILYRYAEAKGLDVSASADLSEYSDMEDISDWALDAMQWAVAVGIIQGRTSSTTIEPQGTSTRAEVAMIFKRYIEDFIGEGDISEE